MFLFPTDTRPTQIDYTTKIPNNVDLGAKLVLDKP